MIASIDSVVDYLVSNGSSMERFDFDHPDEAREFARKLRFIIDDENAHGMEDQIHVEVSNTVVRVRLTSK